MVQPSTSTRAMHHHDTASNSNRGAHHTSKQDTHRRETTSSSHHYQHHNSSVEMDRYGNSSTTSNSSSGSCSSNNSFDSFDSFDEQQAWMSFTIIEDDDLMFGGKPLCTWYEEDRRCSMGEESASSPCSSIDEDEELHRGRQRDRPQYVRTSGKHHKSGEDKKQH